MSDNPIPKPAPKSRPASTAPTIQADTPTKLNADELIQEGIKLLPADGGQLEFDDFKDRFYSAFPDGSEAAFAYMIKKDLIKKVMGRNAAGKPAVFLSRKS